MGNVLIGDKEIDLYQKAIEKQLDESDVVKVMSRGQENNGKALDIVEIVRREEIGDIQTILTDTAEFNNDDGEVVRVTELEIRIV